MPQKEKQDKPRKMPGVSPFCPDTEVSEPLEPRREDQDISTSPRVNE